MAKMQNLDIQVYIEKPNFIIYTPKTMQKEEKTKHNQLENWVI